MPNRSQKKSVTPKVDPHYGSDPRGLVWGYRFSPSQPGQAISGEEAESFLSNPSPQGEFLWLHFSLSNSSASTWLQTHLKLPYAFYDSIGSPLGSTRLELDENSLFAVIHDVLFDFSLDTSEIATATLCITPQVLISIRLHPLRSIDQLKAEVKKGEIFRSTVEILSHLLLDQVSVLLDIQRRITARVDVIEDQLLANQIKSTRVELGSMRRLLVRLQRLLAPEPAALFRLINRPPEWIRKEDLQGLQHTAEEFAATVGDSSVLVERIKLIQEELASFVSEESNRILFLLTIVTVLALPINLVAGLFGMNVGGIPLSEHTHGFAIVVGTLVILTAFLVNLILRRFKD